MPYSYLLEIAGIKIGMETHLFLQPEPEFADFLITDGNADFTARYHQVDQLPPIPAEILHEDNCYRVHPDGKGGYIRSFFDAPRDLTPYAVAVWDGSHLDVPYLEKGARCVSQMHNSFFHLGFEELLIRRDRLCFHAACVDTPLGGILFSGRSGIGKSTQAELWCRHRNARQINGDRPVLSKEEAGWLAWGSPYAGSSGVHVNDHCPVSAIVMLQQAEACSLRQLSSGEAFRAVWSGLTMHSWNEQFVEKACDLALELIDQVPVYEFACTPDEAAVRYLEQALRKEGCL